MEWPSSFTDTHPDELMSDFEPRDDASISAPERNDQQGQSYQYAALVSAGTMCRCFVAGRIPSLVERSFDHSPLSPFEIQSSPLKLKKSFRFGTNVLQHRRRRRRSRPLRPPTQTLPNFLDERGRRIPERDDDPMAKIEAFACLAGKVLSVHLLNYYFWTGWYGGDKSDGDRRRRWQRRE